MRRPSLIHARVFVTLVAVALTAGCTTTVSFTKTSNPETHLDGSVHAATTLTYTATRGPTRRFADYSHITSSSLRD